jgi:hypothetical protein
LRNKVKGDREAGNVLDGKLLFHKLVCHDVSEAEKIIWDASDLDLGPHTYAFEVN